MNRTREFDMAIIRESKLLRFEQSKALLFALLASDDRRTIENLNASTYALRDKYEGVISVFDTMDIINAFTDKSIYPDHLVNTLKQEFSREYADTREKWHNASDYVKALLIDMLFSEFIKSRGCYAWFSAVDFLEDEARGL